MIPSARLHLLNQDNSIPGNRKDGFRYHHLLFICVATPLYLWLELSFGVSLLDNIGGQIIAQDTASIEHWGRLISGLAVSLLFLGGWVHQCERNDLSWPVRVLGGIGISLACILLTWWAQDRVIDFYVKRTKDEITVALRVLAVLMLAGFLILRYWIRRCMILYKGNAKLLAGGVIVLLLLGHLLIAGVFEMLPNSREHLGIERQQVATLTLVRRGIEERIYALERVERDPKLITSPEGKTFLALFPIFGSALDQSRFINDRPMLIEELMYRDWDQTYGAQAFAGYQEVLGELREVFSRDYQAGAAGQPRLRAAFDGQRVRPGLGWEEFVREPAARRFLRVKIGCLDCEFTPTMGRPEFGRELFRHTQRHSVRQAVETFASPQHFETGRDGERAARIYWVPIWALLFSMLGAFTHIFKLIFTVTEYAHRLTFHAVRAADSPLAHRVIANSRVVTALVVLGAALVVYFADNRVTAHERYLELRPTIWSTHPIAGGLAAHWTVNAQGFVYPFTSKIRPRWLTFESDPLAYLPFIARDGEIVE